MATKVLVTGASGFIAQHVILQLLDKGYDIRGTLRSMKRADEVRAVLARHNAKAAGIEFVEADLSDDKGWAQAVAGCQFVQHIASPLPTVMPKNEDDLIKPARDGALRVLAAAKVGGVKRVVMTSSIAAVLYGLGDKRPKVADETSWSDPGGKDNTAYTKSKTFAERAAWEYVNGPGKGLELAVINPSLVLGPVLSADTSTSLQVVIQLLGGKAPGLPRLGFTLVDVRDVAACHVAAMEVPAAAGERFIAANEFTWMTDCAAILREAFPTHAKKIPTRKVPDWLLKLVAVFQPIYSQTVTELGRERHASHAKAEKVLGVTFRPGKTALIDAGKSLIELGVV